MKIGIVLAQPPGYSETFFNSKIHGLQAQGFEVNLFCQKNRSDFMACQVKTFPAKERTITLAFSFLITYISLLPYLGRIIKWYRFEKPTRFIKFLTRVYLNAPLLKAELDWLHFGFGTMALGKESLAKVIGAQMAVSFRGFDIGIYPIKYPNCYQKTWEYLDQLHVISNDLHQLAIREGLPSTIPVVKITPAIDVHFFKPKEPTQVQNSSSLQLISVGRLHWKKGFEETMRALNIVKKAGYDFTYTIIGEGDQYERIAYAAYEFGFLEQVRFLGKLSREEVKEEVEAAEIYIQYSIQEGFCNAVLEAQALGKLCVVSDAEGLSENVLHEQTGWVVPKLQPELLAEKIIVVSQLSEEEKNKITSRAMARVKEEFHIEKQQRAFVNFYQLPL